MKKLYRNICALLTFGFLTASTAMAQSDLVLTGLYDGPLSGGTPKGVEIYVLNNIADLSIYGLGSANNGGGTDGEEFTFPAVSATAGSFIYVTSDSLQFLSFFGFSPDWESGSMLINGDDAIELFMNGSVADVFGDINVDGTGQPWEYLDGWASRVSCTGPDDSTFVLANWTFSGINQLEGGATNATCTSPMPVGAYAPCGSSLSVQFSQATQSYNENATTITVEVSIANPDANPTTVEAHLNVGASTAVNTVDYMVTTPQTLTFPGNSSTPQSFAFILTDDALPEGNEIIVFDLMNPTNGAILGTDSVQVITIVDNDIPVLSFNGTSTTVAENVGSVTLTIDIANPAASATTVDVSLNAGASSATDGPDFTFGATQTVTFPGGSSASQTVVIPIIDDGTTEPTEDFVIELSNPGPLAALGPDSAYTVTITDDDLVYYDIGDVTGIDGNGVADSTGVVCGLRGVVYGVNMRSSGLQFTIIDPTDGIGVISFTADYGYTVTEGDSIEVRGTIGQFNGLTQMTLDTVIPLTTNNNLKPATVVTVLDETTESDLVRINGVWLTDPLQWTNTGGGFNVDVTDGNSTWTVRIDAETDVFGMPAPTGMLDVCGIGGQFDSSSPFDDGYQLLPRYDDDIKIIVDLGPDQVVCGDVVLDAGHQGLTYFWSTNESTQTITASTSGTYIVIVQYGSYSTSDTIQLTIDTQPVANFSAPDSGCVFLAPVVFTDNSTDALSWDWDFGNGNTSTTQNPTHTYTTAGTFTVTLVVTNGNCTDTMTHTIVISVCPGMEEFGAGEVAVYPTLADEFVNVQLNLGAAQDIVLSLTDLSGRIVQTEALGTISTGTHQLQLDALSGGIYFLNVAGEEARSTYRIVVR